MVMTMRCAFPLIGALILVAMYSTSAVAAKPTDPEPSAESGFVGYSEGTLQHGTSLTLQGAEHCRDSFGDGATIAHLRELIEAADKGTFVPASTTTASGWALAKVMGGIPSGTNIYYPLMNALKSGPSQVIIGDQITLGAISTSTNYHIACVIR